MDQKMGMVVLAIICGIILLVLLLRKRAQIILNFLVRTVLGAIMILLVNDILQKQGFDIYVGLNPVTLLTSGTLGFPGVALQSSTFFTIAIDKRKCGCYNATYNKAR